MSNKKSDFMKSIFDDDNDLPIKNEVPHPEAEKKQKEAMKEHIKNERFEMSYIKNESLDAKIQAVTLDDEEFYKLFTNHDYESGDKNFIFIVMKHDQKDKRFHHCSSHKRDVITIPEIVERFGPGRFRLMIKYYNPQKILRGGKRGGFVVAYRDRTLLDPEGGYKSFENAATQIDFDYEDKIVKLYNMTLKVTEILEKNVELFFRLNEKIDGQKLLYNACQRPDRA